MVLINKNYLISIVFLFFIACENNQKCINIANGRLLQEYQASNEYFSLWVIDQGAFGSSVTLRICNLTQNKILEEVILRGEEYLPQIDSVLGNKVYIHYSFPRKSNQNKIEHLKFEDIVLGDALINKSHLTHNYVFTNTTK